MDSYTDTGHPLVFCLNFDANLAKTCNKGCKAYKTSKTTSYNDSVSSAHTAFSPSKGMCRMKSRTGLPRNHRESVEK